MPVDDRFSTDGREVTERVTTQQARTVGKAIPFDFGAVIGGVGSFTFGRDVVKAARLALPGGADDFPDWLVDYEKLLREPAEPSRAASALEAASSSVKDFGEAVSGKVGLATEVFRSVDLDGGGIPDEARALTAAKRAGGAAAGTASNIGGKATAVFRSVDRDGDGVPDEARALSVAKAAGSGIAAAAGSVRGRATSLFGSRKRQKDDAAGAGEVEVVEVEATE